MITTDAVVQLARILGRDEFYQKLSLEEGQEARGLTPAQVGLVHALAQERLQTVVDALLAEALANDDIVSVEAADAYVEERLAFFAELLTEVARQAIRQGYKSVSAQWT